MDQPWAIIIWKSDLGVQLGLEMITLTDWAHKLGLQRHSHAIGQLLKWNCTPQCGHLNIIWCGVDLSECCDSGLTGLYRHFPLERVWVKFITPASWTVLNLLIWNDTFCRAHHYRNFDPSPNEAEFRSTLKIWHWSDFSTWTPSFDPFGSPQDRAFLARERKKEEKGELWLATLPDVKGRFMMFYVYHNETQRSMMVHVWHIYLHLLAKDGSVG